MMRGSWRHGVGRAGPSSPPASWVMVALPVGTQRAVRSPGTWKAQPSRFNRAMGTWHVKCWLTKLEAVSSLHKCVCTHTHIHTPTHIGLTNKYSRGSWRLVFSSSYSSLFSKFSKMNTYCTNPPQKTYYFPLKGFFHLNMESALLKGIHLQYENTVRHSDTVIGLLLLIKSGNFNPKCLQ